MERRGEPEFTVIAEHQEDDVRVIDRFRMTEVTLPPALPFTEREYMAVCAHRHRHYLRLRSVEPLERWDCPTEGCGCLAWLEILPPPDA